MSLKPRFDLSARTAVELLLSQEIASLHTDVRALRFDRMVIIDSLENYCRLTGASLYQYTRRGVLSDGCTLRSGERYIILYNELGRGTPDRINWTLAHEVGHICLEHQQDGAFEEIEANCFASELLMPEILLRHLAATRRMGCFEVQEMFHVSAVAAQRRIRTLENRRYYRATPQEQALLDRYLPLLEGARCRTV